MNVINGSQIWYFCGKGLILEKYILWNKKLGYYQGSFMQMAFWSKLECISDYVIAFNNIKDIENYVMTKFYKELEPYNDYYGRRLISKFTKSDAILIMFLYSNYNKRTILCQKRKIIKKKKMNQLVWE